MIRVGDRVILKKTAESIFKLDYYYSDNIHDPSIQKGTILDITDSPFTSHKLYHVDFDNGQKLWIMENLLDVDEFHKRKFRISTILKSGTNGETT